MKYHPEIKADPLSRENLVAWLLTQPADKTYAYTRPDRCMLGQWVRSIDRKAHNAKEHGSLYYKVHGEIASLSHFNDIAIGNGEVSSWTFGQALARAQQE